MSSEIGGPAKPRGKTPPVLEVRLRGAIPMPTPRVAVLGGVGVMAIATMLGIAASYGLPIPDPAREARIISPNARMEITPMAPVQAELTADPQTYAPPPPPARAYAMAPPAPAPVVEPVRAEAAPPPPEPPAAAQLDRPADEEVALAPDGDEPTLAWDASDEAEDSQ